MAHAPDVAWERFSFLVRSSSLKTATGTVWQRHSRPGCSAALHTVHTAGSAGHCAAGRASEVEALGQLGLRVGCNAAAYGHRLATAAALPMAGTASVPLAVLVSARRTPA